MDEKQELGTKIRTLRKERGLTQEQLAEKLDIDNKHLSKIEQGRHMPTYRLIKKLSEVLNFNIYDTNINTENSDKFCEKKEDEIYLKSLKILNSAKTKKEKQYYYDILHLAQKGIKIGKVIN